MTEITTDTNNENNSENIQVANKGDTTPHHIVAIGASAGGLEALQDLFDHIPGDTGAAFVVIQHLSPDFDSMMDQLLGKHSSMPAIIANDDVQILPNQIYLLAPKKSMTIQEGCLILTDRKSEAGRLDLPINDFLRSLAMDRQNRSVAIILSGTGSDGSLGIKSVHEVGGLVMVQDPEESQFDGMPRNAISTGVVDMTAPVADLAEQLVSFFNRPLVAVNSTEFREHLAQHQNTLQNIFDLLQQQTGIDFSDYKPSTIARRLEHRMSISGVSALPEYLEVLRSAEGQKEIDALKQDLLIIVTEFFRDTDSFEALAQKAIRRLLLTKPEGETIRIWVLGCATGEEAYSIGMLFFEQMQHLNIDRDFKIFATDINQNATTFAAAGTYPQTITNEVSEKRLASFFSMQDDGSFMIHKFLRDRVIFAVHDILKDPPFSNIDLVSCRNLLIYFQPHGQRKALSLMNFSLNNGGLMFLGGAESPTGLEDSYKVIDYKARLYEKIGEVQRHAKSYATPNKEKYEYPSSGQSTRMAAISQTLAGSSKEDRTSAVLAAIDTLFDQYLPPTLIIDHKMEVLYSYGQLERFLQPFKPGRMYTQLQDMLKKSISSYISSAINKVNETGKPVIFEDIGIVDDEDGETILDIRIVPYKPRARSDANAYIISFETEGRVRKDRQTDAVRYKPDEAVESRLYTLEEELEGSRLELRLAHQELGAVREELQSANEELMASNEELQGTNEELQSVNEELYTVNSEYQEKITELSIANDDLDNFLRSTGVAALFLDKENRIRRYTPEFVNYVNVLPVDIHRPFLDLSLPFDVSNLKDHLLKVLLNDKTYHQEEITLNDGRFALLRLYPYTNSSRVTDGVVMVIDDITTYRNAINKLMQREREAMKSSRLSKLGSLSLNIKDQTVQMSNAVLSMLNIDTSEPVFSLDEFRQMVHEKDRERVSERLEQAFSEGELVTNFRLVSARNEEMLIHCAGILHKSGKDQGDHLFGIIQNISNSDGILFDVENDKLELYTLLENVIPGILVLDEASRIVTCNKTLEIMTGFPDSELFGMNIQQLIHQDDQRESRQSIASCFGEQLPACLYEARLNTREQNAVWAEVMASAVASDSSANGPLLIVTVRDINHLKLSIEDSKVKATARLARIFSNG